MSILRRTERLERLLLSGPAGECGMGLLLPKGTPSRWCGEHGRMCWWREDPKDLAEAALMLEALEREGRLDVTDDIEPSPEQIEEARRFMLARGYQLEEGA
jgi:hypothetical protein